VDTHLSGIASDSREQSQGIEQISTTVASMDGVTQNNASTAEETASAAVQLHSQAEALLRAVDRLGDLVDGDGQRPAPPQPKTKTPKQQAARHLVA
jgi:hypothetical protein